MATTAGRAGEALQRFRRPILIAHRFGNDPALVRQAVVAGADLVEVDVWFHRGRLEVRHTKTLGPVPVRWDRWSLEPSWRPVLQLEELLDAIDPGDELLCDLKGSAPGFEQRLVETLRSRRPGHPILICSPNWAVLERFRRFDEARLIHSIGYPWQLRAAWKRLTPELHDTVSVKYRLLNAEVVAALKERVGTVVTWPINDEARLDEVLGWGVDGITTDSADVLRLAAARRAEGG